MEKTTEQKIGTFEQRRDRLTAMGGETMVKKQHEQGKLTARERIDLLFDKGTFQEAQLFVKHRSTLFGLADKEINADGVVTGFGRVNGRIVFAAAQDFTSAGGSLGEMHARKIWKVMDMAVDAKKPFVALNDSGGARIQEGIAALVGYSGVFYRNSIASGYIPQISAIMGPTAGGPSTPRRSRTGSSWSRIRVTCTSPARRRQSGHSREVTHEDLGAPWPMPRRAASATS